MYGKFTCGVVVYPLLCIKIIVMLMYFFFFSSRRRHTRCSRDWSSDVCSSDLYLIWVILQQAFSPLATKLPKLCCSIPGTRHHQTAIRRESYTLYLTGMTL